MDADPACASERADVETLPLARLAQAPPGAIPGPAGGRPSLAGAAPAPAPAGAPLAPTGAPPIPAGTPRVPVGRRLASSHLTRQLGLFTCYLAAGIAVTWPRATYL
ncbi:MAG TPA: hypothetical protein VGJ54_13330, partial [Streptosporangiaceae bacterium]